MKSAVLENIEKISIKEIEKPKVSEGDILIKVKDCAICSTDVKIFHHGYSGIVFPHVLGHEFSGVIDKIGKKGGYVASPSHDIPGDAKAENIAAMIEVLQGQ